MNSAKKGPCYGFKLSSLDSLTITKSGTDKQRNLLNYIVDMINSKYPELKNFHTELNYIKDVEQHSMENILTETRQLERDNNLLKTELENRIEDLAKQNKAGGDNKSKAAQNAKLQGFYDKSTDITNKIKKDSDTCQKTFNECAEYFGEASSKNDLSVNMFFGYFSRFINAWKNAETQNEQRRRKLEAEARKQAAKDNVPEKSAPTEKVTMRHRQSDLINELNQRNKPTISPQNMQDGDFENIILGLKNEPYRTTHNVNGDIHRKSYRRQRSSNSHRLTEESGPM